MAEEFDARRQQQVGNFPQAFSHVGLVNAARTLFEEEARPNIAASSKERIPAWTIGSLASDAQLRPVGGP
jgi:hypothetical protein